MSEANETVWIDPRTKEPCRRCDGTGKMPPWPGSKGLVACGVCRETDAVVGTPCMEQTYADNGRLQICARYKGHPNSHYSRSGWLWTSIRSATHTAIGGSEK